jgi:pyruvate formate lyase activating enzyme
MASSGLALTAAYLGSCGSASAADEPPLHEAQWYKPLDGKSVQCVLCPRNCVVQDGRRGHCGVRENRGGKYYSLVYGRPVSVHIDPIEKKPFFHVYPGSRAFSIATVGCNIDCKFCQNWEISQALPEDVSPPYVSPAEIADAAAKSGAKTIAYTYNEPTIFYEYMADCARAGKERGIESIIISNGFISDEAQKALFPLVKAIKIDLKAFTQAFYGDTCGGVLDPVLETLKRLSRSGVWFEIVNLLIPTLNDNPDDLKRMAAWIVKELGPDVPLIFTAYHPAYKIMNIPPTPGKTLEGACAIALEQGCHYVYGGNVPGMKASGTYCPACRNLVVERYGYTILKTTNGTCDKCGAKIPGIWG